MLDCGRRSLQGQKGASHGIRHPKPKTSSPSSQGESRSRSDSIHRRLIGEVEEAHYAPLFFGTRRKVMITFVSSCAHEQVSMLRARLRGHRSRKIDPQEVCRSDSLVILDDEKTLPRLTLGRNRFSPSVIYWNSRPRADAAMPPAGTKYVGAFRSRLSQFFEDLSFAFPAELQLPGTLSAVARAESKPWLLGAARHVGLTIPAFTWNVIGKRAAEACHRKNGRAYRKVLGFPHVVTEAGEGVTTVNTAFDCVDRKAHSPRHPWQYQAIVPFVAQWRCQVVGNKVWAARWNHKPHGDVWDLRYHQEILDERPSFIPNELDSDVARRLAKLVALCGLAHAAPEFLEQPDGSMVFIDMNPCGDWKGFFGRHWEAQIADALTEVILGVRNANRT